MARFAPIATLATVAALGGALFVANEVNNSADIPALVGQPPGNTAGETPGGAPGAPVGAPAPPAPAPPAVAPQAPPAAAPDGSDTPAAPDGSDAPDAVPAPPAITDQAYAGRSAGNEVTVAVAVKDGRAVGYVCDGDALEAWLEGTLEGDQLRMADGGGATTLAATSTPEATYGTVTVDGREIPFSAAAVDAPAGLYEGNASVRGVVTRVGWIVTGDGEVTGVANSGGLRGPAPALDPTDPYAAEVSGVPMAVSALDGSDAVVRR